MFVSWLCAQQGEETARQLLAWSGKPDLLASGIKVSSCYVWPKDTRLECCMVCFLSPGILWLCDLLGASFGLHKFLVWQAAFTTQIEANTLIQRLCDLQPEDLVEELSTIYSTSWGSFSSSSLTRLAPRLWTVENSQPDPQARSVGLVVATRAGTSAAE